MIELIYRMMIEAMIRETTNDVVANFKEAGIDMELEFKINNIDFDKLAEQAEKFHNANVEHAVDNSPVQSDDEQDMFSVLNTDSNIEFFKKLFGGHNED